MCKPNISGLFRAPALSEMGVLDWVPVMPSSITGTIDSGGTIQPELLERWTGQIPIDDLCISGKTDPWSI